MIAFVDMHVPFQLSQADGRPMYAQIIDMVKQLVVSGEWVTGQAMPSIRELSASLKVSVITVKRAYQDLEREGVIYTRHGMGSYIADQTSVAKEQKMKELEQHLKKAFELAQLLNLEDRALVERLEQLIKAHSDIDGSEEP